MNEEREVVLGLLEDKEIIWHPEYMATTSPRPWRLEIEPAIPSDYRGVGEPAELRGITDANGDWVVRFDDDYGTDQVANAALIVKCVNEATKP